MFEVFGGGGFALCPACSAGYRFFSSLIAVLYYLGIMQLVIKILGGWFTEAAGHLPYRIPVRDSQHLCRTNWKPAGGASVYLRMTNSELLRVMCGGLASWPVPVLRGYAQIGVPLEYLIAASFMAAPGGLLSETDGARNRTL